MIAIGFDQFFLIFVSLLLIALSIAWGRLVWRSSAQGWNPSQELP